MPNRLFANSIAEILDYVADLSARLSELLSLARPCRPASSIIRIVVARPTFSLTAPFASLSLPFISSLFGMLISSPFFDDLRQ
jgi:hypothetical protein